MQQWIQSNPLSATRQQKSWDWEKRELLAGEENERTDARAGSNIKPCYQSCFSPEQLSSFRKAPLCVVHTISSNISPVLFPSLFLLLFPVGACYISCSCLQFLDILLFLSVLQDSIDIASSVEIEPGVQPIRSILHFSYRFLIASIPIWVFLRVSTSLLTLPSVLTCCLLYPVEPLAYSSWQF